MTPNDIYILTGVGAVLGSIATLFSLTIWHGVHDIAIFFRRRAVWRSLKIVRPSVLNHEGHYWVTRKPRNSRRK